MNLAYVSFTYFIFGTAYKNSPFFSIFQSVDSGVRSLASINEINFSTKELTLME